MRGSLRPYVSLVRGKLRATPGTIMYSWNTILALIPASVLAGINWLTFGRYLLLSTSSMIAIALSVYIYNDLTDIEIDRLNKLDRPLVTGEVSKEHAKNLIIVLAFFGLTIAFIINLDVFLLQLTYFVLFFAYSFPLIRLKNKFLIKDLTIAVGTAISYLVGGAAVGMLAAPIFLMALFGFCTVMTMSTVKDCRDIEGDRLHKVKTLPVVWGPKIAVRFSIALVCLIGAATIIGYYQLGFNIAFPILASFAFAAWIYILYPLFQRWHDSTYVMNTIYKRVIPITFSIQLFTILGVFV